MIQGYKKIQKINSAQAIKECIDYELKSADNPYVLTNFCKLLSLTSYIAMTSRNLRSNTIFECLCSSSIPLYYSSNSDQFNHDSNYIRAFVNSGRVWLHQMKELEGGEKATQHRDHPFRTSANLTPFWTPPPRSVGFFYCPSANFNEIWHLPPPTCGRPKWMVPYTIQ